MLSKFPKSASGIAYKKVIKSYNGEKPKRKQNESDDKYADRIAKHPWATPTIDSIKLNREKIEGLPIWNRHEEEEDIYGYVRGCSLEYNNDGTADVRVDVDLSERGYELLVKYKYGLSLCFTVSGIYSDHKRKFSFVELSLTPNPRISGSLITRIQNDEYGKVDEIIKINFNYFEKKIKESNMSEETKTENVEKKTETVESGNNSEVKTNENKSQQTTIENKPQASDEFLKRLGQVALEKDYKETTELNNELKKRKLVDDSTSYDEVYMFKEPMKKYLKLEEDHTKILKENEELKKKISDVEIKFNNYEKILMDQNKKKQSTMLEHFPLENEKEVTVKNEKEKEKKYSSFIFSHGKDNESPSSTSTYEQMMKDFFRENKKKF